MRDDVVLAAAGVSLLAVTGVFGWVVLPTKALVCAGLIVVPSLVWAFLELANTDRSEAGRGIRRAHRLSIAAGCLIVFLDVATDLGTFLGLGPEWLAGGTRLKGLWTGAFFILWGNYLPKLRSPWGLQREPFDWQRVHRFIGRVFLVGGTVMMGGWALLPLGHARRVAVIACGATVVLAVGRKVLSVASYSMRGGATAR